MEKIWYILIDGKKEGPYSVSDLRRHFRVTPDTLVWKEGFAVWVPLRQVPELKAVFEDEKQGEEEDTSLVKKVTPESELVLAMRREPPSLWFWLLITCIVLAYAFYQLYSR